MKLNIFKIDKSAVFCVLLSLKSMLVLAQAPVPQFWQLNNSPNTLTWDKTPWDTQIDNSTGSFTATSINWMGNNGRSYKFMSCKDIVFGGNPGVNPAGTVTLSAASNSVKSLTFHPAASGNFTIASSPATNAITSCSTDLPVNVDATLSPTVSSVFSGSNSLTKSGSGTLVLTGTNTYTGATNVTDGILQIGNGVTNGTTGTGDVYVNAGMLDYNQPSNFTTNSKFFAKTNTVIRKRGASTMTIPTTPNTPKVTMDPGATLDIVAGTFYSTGIGTVYLNNKGSLNIASGAQLSIYGDNGFFDALTGGGSYYLSWLNNSGSRQLTIGISNTVNNSQYGVANNTAEFSGVISINGYAHPGPPPYNVLDLIKVGTGTQILSGNNQYRNTTISGGVLQVGNNTITGSLGNGNVVNNATLKIYRSDDITFSNLISGTGNVVKEGSNTVTVTVNNSYSGGTTINGGTLVANNTTALGSGAVTINNGGTLTLNANILNAITVNAGGTLNKNGHTTGLVTGSGTVNP